MKIYAIISLLAVSLVLGACGRKGDLAPPPGADPDSPGLEQLDKR